MAPCRAFRRRTALTCTLLLALLAVAPASAAPKLQVIGETSLGYTDNVRTAPETPLPNDTTRSAGALLMLSPGVVLAFEAPGTLQRIGYRYEYDLVFAESDASSSSQRLDYRAFWELSRRVTLVLGANVTESNRYTAIVFAPPGAGELVALPAGAGAFLQASADQAFGFDLGVLWRGWQSGTVLVETPILGTDAPQTTAVGLRSGVERSFFVDAAGVEARADYTVIADGTGSDGSPLGVQRQLVTGGVVLWRHDWGRYFASTVEAGSVRVQRLNTGLGFWSPIGAAALAYANDFGEAQLSYAHTVTTNALLGQSLLVDEVRLRGALPLTHEGELVLGATAGYQHGRLIDENANLAAEVDVILGDVSLGWQVTQALELGLRYQYIKQISDALAAPLPLSFVQNNVLIGATLRFPPERDMPRRYRAPRRVDRSDEIREDIGPTAGSPREPGS
jgi:hypothetical protein